MMKTIYLLSTFISLFFNSKQYSNFSHNLNSKKNVLINSNAKVNLIKNTFETKPSNTKCLFSDINIMVKDKKMVKSFFKQVNSWREKNDKKKEFLDDSIFVCLNEEKLINFLSNIKKNKVKNSFEKKYEYNSSPLAYKSKRKCEDFIRINFDEKECIYIITIKNSFYVEGLGCSEHDLFYEFKINKRDVKLINIDGAG